MKIAVIPARGGSKRIPRKNIKDFCGKPMIAWSIDVAKESGLFDHILVTTDDEEIASVARQYGAEVPFLRPSKLSDDYAGTTEVVAHATRWAMDQGWPLSAVCCLYATAAFTHCEDLEYGLTALQTGNWDFTFSATEYPAPIFRAFQQVSGGGLRMFFPEHFVSRSQDLPSALHDAGQFYWGKTDAWLQQKIIFSEKSFPIILPRIRVQDIDTASDWTIAEILFKLDRTSDV